MFKPYRGVDSDLMVIGDSPSKKDLENGVCFSGSGALFLIRELEAVGVKFPSTFAMTCLDFYPPSGKAENVFLTATQAKKDHTVQLVNGAYVKPAVLKNAKRVWETIDKKKPKRILALGSLALWMLTGEQSITKFRGSLMEIKRPWGTIELLPTYHPSAVMRVQEFKRVFRHDLTKLTYPSSRWKRPDFSLKIYPTVQEIEIVVNNLLKKAEKGKVLISSDIETRGKMVSVWGIGWSPYDAIAIPFFTVKKANYFTMDEEFKVIKLLTRLVTHPNIEVAGQNYHYDDQYLARYYGIPHHCTYDTMHMAHVIWTKNLPLSLDFLASMFCQWYQFWKDDGKEFHKSIEREEDEKIYFKYNAMDCCYTWEIADVLRNQLSGTALQPVYQFQQKMHRPLSRTMNRGVRFDSKLQAQMRSELTQRINAYARWFESLPINDWFKGDKGVPWYDSAHKLKIVFYDKLGIEPINKRTPKGMRPTCDQNALLVIGKREPILKSLCEKLCEYSSMNQFLSLYLSAKPDTDGRMRSNYGLAGTDTFRLSSKGDVFGTGMNLQNISKG
jgi:uracil-DNA glycosylase